MSPCRIVIPTFGRPGLTTACVRTILSEPPRAPFEIVVSDDGSPNGAPSGLEELDPRVRVVPGDKNRGFATACNRGARSGSGRFVVFLNNDTRPLQGWLDALVQHADEHPNAAAVGSKLLFPDGTVQHAGVVFGQDGFPRHLYAGFPADHPAVSRSRQFQAVTAACVLVRRRVFEALGGFDQGFRNGMEDVDLCLRMREAGYEIHYCPGSRVIHLESVTRGRRSPDIRQGVARFRERWGARLHRDDVHYYVDDGLLELEYRDGAPMRITASPELAVSGAEDGASIERVLVERSRQAAALLRDVVLLSAEVAGLVGEPTKEHDATGPEGDDLSSGAARDRVGADRSRPTDVTARIDGLLAEIFDLQADLSDRAPSLPTPEIGHRRSIEEIRASVTRAVPQGSTVVVASRGVEGLVELDGLRGWHFPRDPDGRYAGHHPADGDLAVQELERLMTMGAEYFVLPRQDAWWLERYPELAAHLARWGPSMSDDGAPCLVYSLQEDRSHVSIG